MSVEKSWQLKSGVTIRLKELRQWEFYEGLLEGLPTTEMNRRRLQAIIAEHSKPYGEPFLIEPIEVAIQIEEGRRYPFGNPAELPAIVCVARFDSLSHSRNKEMDYSGLSVIWFQSKFAFPIDPAVIERIEEIDWRTQAFDMYY